MAEVARILKYHESCHYERSCGGVQGLLGGNFGCGEGDRHHARELSHNIDTQIQKSPESGKGLGQKPLKCVDKPGGLMDEYTTQNSPYNYSKRY